MRTNILFTPEAYVKMFAVIDNYDTEVCWYGVVEKINEYNYLIKDILVHPQNVTSATTRVQDNEMPELIEYMESLPTDIYNAMKFEGHSHVNMSVSRSSQDEETDRAFVNMMMKDGQFVITVVANKKREMNFRIFRRTNGVTTLQENEDVNYSVLFSSGKTSAMFLDEIRENVKENNITAFKQPVTAKSKLLKKDKDDADYDFYAGYYNDWMYE